MIRALTLCASMLSSIFSHGETKVRQLDLQIKKAFEPNARIEDYGLAIVLIDELKERVTALSKSHRTKNIQDVLSWIDERYEEGYMYRVLVTIRQRIKEDSNERSP
jgi:hypothetical protein